jgi:KDO2-lipid IV(A) lauroyltransferase
VESVKLLSISKKSLFKRLKFSGVDQLEQMFDEGRNCAIMTGHYCNWEWYTGIMKYMTRHHQVAAPVIYHPLYNEAFDRLFIDIRSANGCVCVAKNDILRSMFNYKKEGRQTMFGYVSDQSPKWENMHLWLDFLNHDTPVFTGGERIMRKMNDAVFFLDIERPRRGYYNMSFKLITKEAAKEEEFAITRKYYELLEANIRRQPPFYLWTHNRWKRGREEFNLKYDIINGRIVRKEEFK